MLFYLSFVKEAGGFPAALNALTTNVQRQFLQRKSLWYSDMTANSSHHSSALYTEIKQNEKLNFEAYLSVYTRQFEHVLL